MSELKVTGEIVKILPVESGVSNAGKDWKKINFVVNTGAEYNPEICFEIFGDDKVDKFLKYNKVGDNVDVDFNVSSREYNGKYYHNIGAWRVFKSDGEDQEHAQEEESDDMPF